MSDNFNTAHLQSAFRDFLERQGFSLDDSEKERIKWYVGNLIENAYTAGVQNRVAEIPPSKPRENIFVISLDPPKPKQSSILKRNSANEPTKEDMDKFKIIVRTLCELYRQEKYTEELEELIDCMEEEGTDLSLHLYNPPRSRELDDIYYCIDENGSFYSELEYDYCNCYSGSILEWSGTIDSLMDFIQEHTKTAGEIICDKLKEHGLIKVEEYDERE